MKVIKKVEDMGKDQDVALAAGGWCCSCCCWCWATTFN